MANSILKQPKKVVTPFYVRFGSWILLLIFVALLAGRFSLDRLGKGLPGIDLRLGFVYVVVAAILIWFVGAREHLPKRIRVTGSGMFLAWAAWMILSAAWSPPGARMGATVLDMVLLIAFMFTAWGLMSVLPAESTAKIWKWMLVAAVIYFTLAMAAGPGAQGRYAAPGGGPNVFVRIMVLGAIAALYFTSVKKKSWPLLSVPLFAVGAALSGSRGGLLSAGIILTVFAIPIARQLGAKRVFGLLFIAAVGVFFLASMNDGAVVEFVKTRYLEQTLVEGYSSDRDTIAEDALRLFNESPVVGVGADGYWVLQENPEQFEYPHNLFIATMAESGLIGLVLLVGALLRFLFSARRGKPVPTTVLYAAGAGCYQCIASLFSGDYYDTRLMWFFLGFAVIEAARARLAPQPAAAELEPAPHHLPRRAGTGKHRPADAYT